jgi:hypothetical protein
MGLGSVLKKIGKVALVASPYIAAPFTGGASLALTGLANKAEQKWAEHDANNAIAQGKAPSKFDSVLGKAAGISSLATSFMPQNALGAVGLLGKAGSAVKTGSAIANAANTASTASKVGGAVSKGVSIANKIGNVANVAIPAIGAAMATKNANKGIGPSTTPSVAASGNGLGMAPGFAYGSNNPNLATSLNAGRAAAAGDQKFRRGYDVTKTPFPTSTDPNPTPVVISHMPRINTDWASMGMTPPNRRRKSMINDDGTMNYQPVGRASGMY